MNNGTCCALNLHAKSQLNDKIICDKKGFFLVNQHNRKYFLETLGWRQPFAGLPRVIKARISAVYYAARSTR